MPRHGKSKKLPVRTGDAYVRLPLPSGVPVSMCFCGDPCKVDVSVEEDTYRQNIGCVPTMPSIHHLVIFALGCWLVFMFVYIYFDII